MSNLKYNLWINTWTTGPHILPCMTRFIISFKKCKMNSICFLFFLMISFELHKSPRTDAFCDCTNKAKSNLYRELFAEIPIHVFSVKSTETFCLVLKRNSRKSTHLQNFCQSHNQWLVGVWALNGAVLVSLSSRLPWAESWTALVQFW